MKRLFFASLIAMVGITFFSLMMMRTSDAKIDPRTAIVALTFEEGLGRKSVDLSGNKNHATLTKKGIEWGEGKFGGGLVLDGKNGYVEVPNDNDVWAFEQNDFTLAAWVVMDKLSDSPRLKSYVIMAYSTTVAVMWDGWWYSLKHHNAGHQLFFHHCIQCGGPGGGGIDMGPQVPRRFKVKEWHHYGVSRNGKKMTMFYDGKKIGEKAWDWSIKAAAAEGQPLTIGRRTQPGDEYYLDGMMDDVVVFNAAFSEQDMQELVAEGLEAVMAVSPSDKLATTWGRIKKRK